MIITELHVAVIGWLRYEHQCPIVMIERSPWNQGYMYRPDVCGVTKKGQVIEVEIKQTVADFKANSNKREISWRQKGYSFNMPWKFYFAVAPQIVAAVKPLLVNGDGLLTLDEPNRWGPQIKCERGATVCAKAVPVSKRDAIRLVMHQSGTLHRLALACIRQAL